MKDRLKSIRKSLGLNQNDFGARIGCTRMMITSYELGRVVPPEPTIRLICSEFDIRREWLETGEGEMYSRPAPIDPVGEALATVGRSDDAMLRAIIEAWLSLSEDARHTVTEYVRDVVTRQNALKGRQQRIEERVEEFRRELELEEKAREKSDPTSEASVG